MLTKLFGQFIGEILLIFENNSNPALKTYVIAILSLYVHYVFSIGYSTLKYWLNDILKLVATTKLLFATG